MHELTAVEQMVEVALEQAEQAKASRVVGLHFVINEGGSVSPESVELCFSIAAKETPAQAAQLSFEFNPPQYQCLQCSHLFQGPHLEEGDGHARCPQCGENAVALPPQVEFYLDSIDVE